MNKENMQLVVDSLKMNPERFDMGTFGTVEWEPKKDDGSHPCCTAACICGTANLIGQSEEINILEDDLDLSVEDIRDSFYMILRNEVSACEFLGLSRLEGDRLFFGGSNSMWQKYNSELNVCPEEKFPCLEDINIEHAITMLENLINDVWDFSGLDRDLYESEDEDDEEDDYDDSDYELEDNENA